jgi:transposase
MAREMGISKASVSRIWRANGLKPHRVESFKVSNDPHFADKLEAIVGLYLNPPEHALVLSVDEKSQIQALDRTQPGLPLKKGRGQTMTHDYKRNGTTTLFAALNTANGEVYGLCQQKHRHQEWLRFLRMIDQTVPADKEIYLICDNYSTHKHERVNAGWRRTNDSMSALRPPRLHGSTWWNASFATSPRTGSGAASSRTSNSSSWPSENTSTATIKNPKPFIWTAKATDILEKVTRARTALNKRRSA